MARTFLRQDTQVRQSDLYDDTLVPSLANYETNVVSIEGDLNSIRSQLQNFLNRNGASFPSGNWYDDVSAPITFENGSKRGINEMNQQLHDLERKRVLVSADKYLVDITVGAGANYKVLALGELPPNTTAAVGAVTTRGTVSAFHSGTFGTHSLDEVTGSSAIAPKNLCNVVDANTHDPILSSERIVYALFQVESNTDGQTLTGTTPNRAQLSFVRINSTGDDLEAVPVSDIENKVIHYSVAERKALEDLSEQDFLRGAVTDVPASATVTRQVAYNNQGATPVDLTTNAILDLESAGIYWTVRDDAQADLFKITEGSAGGTSTVLIASDVDVLDVNAVANDFLNGASFDTGAAGTTINIGVTANQIDAGGALTVTSAAATDLRLIGAGEMFLDDGNQTGSTWTQSNGIKLSDTTAEWDAFETAFGEVSLLNAITQAYNNNNVSKTYANVTSATVSANTDVGGLGGGVNLDAQLPNLSLGDFLVDYDVYLNGQLLRPGADASANHDYYPGTSLSNGQLKFEFILKINDVIAVVARA